MAVTSEEGKNSHAEHVLRVQNALAQALIAICGGGGGSGSGSGDDDPRVEQG